MQLQHIIKEQIKDAMRAKDEARLLTLRSIVASCTNQLVATNRKPQEELQDEEVLEVIRKLAKQRKDSIEQFVAGGRQDLAQKEQQELGVLEAFLPQSMDEATIRVHAIAKKAELGMTDPSKMGLLVGALMKDLKGQADGGDVKRVVESLFIN
jgi:uncharacterized protein